MTGLLLDLLAWWLRSTGGLVVVLALVVAVRGGQARLARPGRPGRAGTGPDVRRRRGVRRSRRTDGLSMPVHTQ